MASPNLFMSSAFGTSPIAQMLKVSPEVAAMQSAAQPDGGSTDLSRFGSNPYASPLSDSLKSFNPNSYTPYQAKDMSNAALPQYDAIRSRINTQYNQQQQTAQDALDRQFAAMGGGPSGAQAKQTENLAASMAQQKGQDLDSLNAEEANARFQLQQQESQRAFESGETAKQMGIQGQEFLLGQQGTMSQLNTAWAQAQQEAQNNEFNKALAIYQALHS